MIKPCYRNYIKQIDTLFIGFRRDKDHAEFWQKHFRNINVGDTVGFAITGSNHLAQAKADYPLFDFDEEFKNDARQFI